MILDKWYWNKRYKEGQTAWDASEITRPIKEWADSIENKNQAILIPGCGNAHEALYMLNAGFTNITVVDFAEEPIKNIAALAKKFLDNGSLKLIQNDFFELNGNYDMVIEQTFYCAIDPKQRDRYALKMAELIIPNGILAGVFFSFPLSQEGPPFGGSAEEYHKRFSPNFEIQILENCRNSIKPREGRELFLKMKRR